MKVKNKKVQELSLKKGRKNTLLYKSGKVVGPKCPYYLSSICYLTDGKRLPKIESL